MEETNRLIVGIDATNIRCGGGVTHLVELLRALQPDGLGIQRVVVWGCKVTLTAIDDLSWIDKHNLPALDKGLIQRTLFTGSLLYYYYLQFAEFFSFIVFKFFKKFVQALKSTALIRATVVKNTTIQN